MAMSPMASVPILGSTIFRCLLVAALLVEDCALEDDGQRLCRERGGGLKCAPCIHQVACAVECGCQSRLGGELEAGDTECTDNEALQCAARSCCQASGDAPRRTADMRTGPSARGTASAADRSSVTRERKKIRQPSEHLLGANRPMGSCSLGDNPGCAESCGCEVDQATSRLNCPTPTEVACLRRECCSSADPTDRGGAAELPYEEYGDDIVEVSGMTSRGMAVDASSIHIEL
mmetsp:Transcript_95603/g.274400  ORF Transcript_95603/g.274400 Transcript_95603/m.274400 type:complete len:233 (+) Transcript_95603:13-711(+)